MQFSKVFLFVSSLLAMDSAHSLPPAVELGGAVVAAVEQDAVLQQKQLQQEQELEEAAEQRWLQQLVSTEFTGQQWAQLLDKWTTEARGSYHKKKKLLKMLFPLLGAAVVAKLVLLPLVLKWLTALSASSFVMGKIALATAGLLALKSMMSPTHERLEIVHSSAKAPSVKNYHEDLSSSGSSWVPVRHPYIPLGMAKDAAFRYDNKPFL